MDERVRIGKRIKELRKARGLSQERVAEMLDISTNYLSGIECGRENPTLDLLLRLAAALKVDVAALFSGAWFGLTEAELRRKLRALLDHSDLDQLREVLTLMKAREL
jgi:transcriptional regulator with XRE-family HTH domain